MPAALLKAAGSGPLFWRQVPGVLEPNAPTVFNEVLMFFAFPWISSRRTVTAHLMLDVFTKNVLSSRGPGKEYNTFKQGPGYTGISLFAHGGPPEE
jgi:hypothetical protein